MQQPSAKSNRLKPLALVLTALALYCTLGSDSPLNLYWLPAKQQRCPSRCAVEGGGPPQAAAARDQRGLVRRQQAGAAGAVLHCTELRGRGS